MIKVTTRGIDKLQAFLKQFAPGARGAAAKAATEYLIGNQQHGLKHYPPYKHVPWAQIGGFVSDKQRRYVMARIREGSIDPGNSASNGYFRDAWTYKGQSTRYTMVNDTAYGKYLVKPGEQSRRAIAQGWRTYTQTIQDNMAGALRSARAAVRKWIQDRRR